MPNYPTYVASDVLYTTYNDALIKIRDVVKNYASQMWKWRKDYYAADAEIVAQELANMVVASQMKVSDITIDYVKTYCQSHGVLAPWDENLSTAFSNNLPSKELIDRYKGPHRRVWGALNDGIALEEAIDLGHTRLLTLVANDLQQARIDSAQYAMTRMGIQHFERVPSGPNTCDYCLRACEHYYTVNTLMQIHDNCYCGIRPHIGPVSVNAQPFYGPGAIKKHVDPKIRKAEWEKEKQRRKAERAAQRKR